MKQETNVTISQFDMLYYFSGKEIKKLTTKKKKTRWH